MFYFDILFIHSGKLSATRNIINGFLSIVKLVEEEFKQNILIGFGRGHVESSKAIKDELIFK